MTGSTVSQASARTMISHGRNRDFPLTPSVARRRIPTVAMKLTTTNPHTNGRTAAVGPWYGCCPRTLSQQVPSTARTPPALMASSHGWAGAIFRRVSWVVFSSSAAACWGSKWPPWPAAVRRSEVVFMVSPLLDSMS